MYERLRPALGVAHLLLVVATAWQLVGHVMDEPTDDFEEPSAGESARGHVEWNVSER